MLAPMYLVKHILRAGILLTPLGVPTLETKQDDQIDSAVCTAWMPGGDIVTGIPVLYINKTIQGTPFMCPIVPGRKLVRRHRMLNHKTVVYR